MPATSHEMNQAACASALVFTCGAVAINVTIGVTGFDAAPLLYGFAIPAAFMGIHLANLRRANVSPLSPTMYCTLRSSSLGPLRRSSRATPTT